MDDTYPKRVSDPAADGIPEYADDDSTAYDDVDSPRAADGRDPFAVPGDRDDGPVAIDEFGTTPAEQLRGEPMDQRLAREEPDVTPDSLGGALDDDPDRPTDGRLADEIPVDPALGSPVSMYDRPDPALPPDRVGRLVAPDEGAHEDVESDEIAIDAGAAGGGASAEELAMHPVPDDEV